MEGTPALDRCAALRGAARKREPRPINEGERFIQPLARMTGDQQECSRSMRGGEPIPAPPAAAAARSDGPSLSATRPVQPIATIERLSSQATVGIRRRPQAAQGPVIGFRGRASGVLASPVSAGFDRAVAVCKRARILLREGRVAFRSNEGRGSRDAASGCESSLARLSATKIEQEPERSWVRPRVGSVDCRSRRAANLAQRSPCPSLRVNSARRRAWGDGSLTGRNFEGSKSAP